MPNEDCLAAASLVSQLEQLSLLEGLLFDEEHDFAAGGAGVTV
jgi:hypothetical protein